MVSDIIHTKSHLIQIKDTIKYVMTKMFQLENKLKSTLDMKEIKKIRDEWDIRHKDYVNMNAIAIQLTYKLKEIETDFASEIIKDSFRHSFKKRIKQIKRLKNS